VFVLSLLLELPLYRFVCFLERLLVLGNGGIVLFNLRQSATARSLVTVSVTGLICTDPHGRELSNYLLMLIELPTLIVIQSRECDLCGENVDFVGAFASLRVNAPTGHQVPLLWSTPCKEFSEEDEPGAPTASPAV
jgi:hypothetical protein